MAIQTKKYIKCDDYKPLNLDLMYEGNKMVLDNLDYDLEAIINTEGPLTYNTLKERLFLLAYSLPCAYFLKLVYCPS